MKLSAYQLRSLERSLEQRESGPTIAGALISSWKTYLIQIIFLGGLAAFWWWGGWEFGSLIVSGVLIGCIWRDIVWLSLSKRNWPLSKEITDWRRVEELIAQHKSGT